MTGFNVNYSSGNRTSTINTVLYVYRLDVSLLVLISLGSSVGLIFNTLCLIRYCRYPSLRTHFSYVFHIVLFYCLLASLFVNPSLLIGYYGYAFAKYPLYCKCFGTIGSFMYVGIAYTLLYASIERHYLMFRPNGQLTLLRQLVPMSLIFFVAFLTSAAFYLIPRCPFVPCVSCSAYNLQLLVLWQAFSFFVPSACLTCITVLLIVRVKNYREHVRHQRQSTHIRPLRKMTVQLCVYVLWCLVYYCPPALYNLFTAINPTRYASPVMKSISTIIGVLGIRLYPVLTYIMFWNGRHDRHHPVRVYPS